MQITITVKTGIDEDVTQQTYGAVCDWPDNWAEIPEQLFLDAYWLPLIAQLRQYQQHNSPTK